MWSTKVFDIQHFALQDKLQRTALHWAAELNHIEAAEALLDYGCDPLAVECNGRWAHAIAWSTMMLSNLQRGINNECDSC